MGYSALVKRPERHVRIEANRSTAGQLEGCNAAWPKVSDLRRSSGSITGLGPSSGGRLKARGTPSCQVGSRSADVHRQTANGESGFAQMASAGAMDLLVRMRKLPSYPCHPDTYIVFREMIDLILTCAWKVAQKDLKSWYIILRLSLDVRGRRHLGEKSHSYYPSFLSF